MCVTSLLKSYCHSNTRNNSGPRIDSCGTPEIIGFHSERGSVENQFARKRKKQISTKKLYKRVNTILSVILEREDSREIRLYLIFN